MGRLLRTRLGASVKEHEIIGLPESWGEHHTKKSVETGGDQSVVVRCRAEGGRMAAPDNSIQISFFRSSPCTGSAMFDPTRRRPVRLCRPLPLFVSSIFYNNSEGKAVFLPARLSRSHPKV